MAQYSIKGELLIRNATVYDGSGDNAVQQDVLVSANKIVALGQFADDVADYCIDASGLALAPGFIDVHTHDDIEVIRNPAMLTKISQGVTTVVVGNCGISASPVQLTKPVPDPLNLLGRDNEFVFSELSDYIAAVDQANSAVNVVALVGHTALRAQVMNRLDRAATDTEIDAMRTKLKKALNQGAKGLSSGLAYQSAHSATSGEVEALASELNAYQAVYTTHLRTEFDGILHAMDEAFTLGRNVDVPVVISHLKCAGKTNWGRSKQVLAHLQQAQQTQHIGCDCYPYSASSSTLDLGQVTADFDIVITWSDPHPEQAGQTLQEIAERWQMSLLETAEKLQPAGAVYHGMDEADVQTFLQFPGSMIGSDGLPCDPSPHPRLWGTFPRVLGHYARQQGLFSLAQAVRKMTGLSATEFQLQQRGFIKPDYYADLVLFDPHTIKDKASYTDPKQIAEGILMVWVNGQLSYNTTNQHQALGLGRGGRFLKHQQR
ncbi:N-acyl-D-amino-acid deacylase family protein [Neptunicella sp. SCSIO 80796]|uniref:N-acyl-D-amino-acid deacylase family protein n=1 Tax=Neptunicella plasticusilytica TaxID=3117012 RepID=UPI003A4D9F40